MREPPALPNEHIAATLRGMYGLDIVRLEFLPLGYDSSAAVYKAGTRDGRDYFAKLKLNSVYESSVAVPRFIQAAGVPEAIAPLPTLTGAPWGTADGAALLLYPFVAGEQGSQVEWDATLWKTYGDVMRRIHATRASDGLTDMLPREDFVPNRQWRDVVRQLSAEIASRTYDDPLARELASFWRERQAQIDMVVARAEELGSRLQTQPPPFVVCHADMHRNNLLITPEGALYVVDWDQPMFAPRERDLMFALAGVADGKPASAREEAAFFQGYGAHAVDRLALAYYCYDWAMQDIGAFAAQVFLMPDAGPITREEGDRYVRWQFLPNAPVDVAQRLDVGLD